MTLRLTMRIWISIVLHSVQCMNERMITQCAMCGCQDERFKQWYAIFQLFMSAVNLAAL